MQNCHGSYAQGKQYNIFNIAPKSIAGRLREDVECFLWSKTTEYQAVQPYPWLEPFKGLLRTKDTPSWGQPEKGMLRTVCAHGVWPLARLQQAGYDTDGLCLCGELDTLAHRLYQCPITHSYRMQYGRSAQLIEAREEQPHF